MRDGILLGQYFDADSVIHRLDPRLKCALILPVLGASVLVESLAIAAGALILLLLLVRLAKIPFGQFLKNYRHFSWIILLTVGFHVFLGDGRVWYTIPGTDWHLTIEGLRNGCLYASRLVFIIGVSNCFLLTTTPGDLAEGAERLLSPLRWFGVRTGELALMINMSLRFVPTIFEEGLRIRKAQKARGAERDRRLRRRLTNLIAVMFPLVLSVFRRAHDLALAMEARGYVPGAERTAYRNFALQAPDYAAVAVVAVVLGGFVAAG